MRNHLFGDHSRHILRQHSQYYVYFFRTTRPCQLYIEDVSVYVVLVGGAWALLVGRNSCLESGRQRSALTQSFGWMLTRKAPDHMGVGVNQCLPHFTFRSLLCCIMNDTHVVRLPLLMIVTIHGVSLKKTFWSALPGTQPLCLPEVCTVGTAIAATFNTEGTQIDGSYTCIHC